MTHTRLTLATRRSACLLVALLTPALACASVIWFDPSSGGDRRADFGDLVGAYRTFLGAPDGVITFGGLPVGSVLGTQYAGTHGVTFRNTDGGPYGGYSGVQSEGGGIAEDITGYDGGYHPDGDRVYVRFDNDLTPFTIDFATPVAAVGAFVGMGVEGDVHSLTVRAYDRAGTLLGQSALASWLWEESAARQNYESFLGVRADSASIARLEIQNDATTNFANALIVDDVSYTRSIPEPGTLALLVAGFGLTLRHIVRRR